MYADVQAAIQLERRMGKSKAALRDLLNRTCAEYNKLTTVRRHRIDGPRKALLYNMHLGVYFSSCVVDPVFQLLSLHSYAFISQHMHFRLRSPSEFLNLVHRHYDMYPHQQSGWGLSTYLQEPAQKKRSDSE